MSDNYFTYKASEYGWIVTPHHKLWAGYYVKADGGKLWLVRVVCGDPPQHLTIPIRSWEDLR